jgi:hypothetical protein
MRESIETKSKEMRTYDSAIEEIEKNYGDFLFSAEFFSAEK